MEPFWLCGESRLNIALVRFFKFSFFRLSAVIEISYTAAMNRKALRSISSLFHYRLVLDYEESTYPMDIIYIHKKSVFLKTYDRFYKYWSDRISGILINTKAILSYPVSGKIRGLRPLGKKGDDLDFECSEWLIEIEILNEEEIPREWIDFSQSEEIET
ncbi:hypothetical protein EHQ58_09045 [Leptospira ognonensis]|uniref:Uncharacterized protein n=1 Tax=Leptospira ognonensis TaxID=2484945 RepID=A0A4R9K129_9LEPT|nr:hypothetical protein [Leptospira ognonensis]TGL59379.1 hypothetical protein EHQ58_09045 [Leptospira ognonensis]